MVHIHPIRQLLLHFFIISLFLSITISFPVCLLAQTEGGENTTSQVDSTTTESTTEGESGEEPAIDPLLQKLTQLEEQIKNNEEKLVIREKELNKKITALEKGLKGKLSDEERVTQENTLYNLKEILRNKIYFNSLLKKELETRKSIAEMGSIGQIDELPEIPATTQEAQELVNALTLLKNQEALTSGKIESQKAELEAKQAQLDRQSKEETPAEGTDDVKRELKALLSNVLKQEIIVTGLQIERDELKLKQSAQEIKNLQNVVDNIDTQLLSSSEEKIKRKEKQTQRMRRREELKKDTLSQEKESLEKELLQVQKAYEKKKKELEVPELDDEKKELLSIEGETLELEIQLIESQLKFVNWKQTFSQTKIEFDKKRLEFESIKMQLTDKDTPEEVRQNKIVELSQYLNEIEKQKNFYATKAKVFQKEVEQGYILLDQNLEKIEEIELLIEQASTAHLRKLKKERLEQEELIQSRISVTEEIKELMEQFNFHYELQRLKLQELEHLVPSSKKKWYTLRIFNSDITLLQLLYFFLGLVITLIAQKIFHHFTKTKLAKWVNNESLLALFERPLRYLILLIGIFLSLKILMLAGELESIVAKIFDMLIIINISYLILTVVEFLISLLHPIVAQTETKLDDQLIPIIRKAAKIFIVIISAVILIERLGYPVTSIIAGLGIGGLAFALAAKDTIANLFGSLVIFTDRPFQIGDWVIISSSEGVVEEVGVRSTKLRTFSDTLITIPNNTVANATIQNISAFRNRRVYIQLGITYSSGPRGASEAVKIIRNILDEHEMVKTGHYIFFDDFKDSSLNLMVYYFVKSTVWREYLSVREDVNLKIMQRFAEAGIDFAFPTRTLDIPKESQLFHGPSKSEKAPLPSSNHDN